MRQGVQEVHTVERVIITHTDHDFVRLSIEPDVAPAVAGPTRMLTPAKRAVRKITTTLGAAGALLLATPAGNLTTTYHHPFYDLTRNAFVQAEGLHVGDPLQTPPGTARVTSRHLFHTTTTTYDLTIDHLHTYYVVAGGVPILVHNTNGCPIGSKVGINSGGLASKAFNYRMSTIGLKLRNVAVATVEGRAEPVYGLSNGEDFHSEDHILSQLNPGEKITALYSERQPCPRCAGRLSDFMSPDAEVTWSVPWGDPNTELGALINTQSNADLRDMLRRAAGF